MNDRWITTQIRTDEGFQHVAYLDSEGRPTVGWGHHDDHLIVDEFYRIDLLETWFDEDYKEAVRGYNSLGLELDEVRRGVMIMMVFNLGLGGVKTFKKMLGHLVAQDYEMAGVEGLKSKWRKQVKARSHRMMAAMITGEWV